MLRPLTIGSWQKARRRGCKAGEVCARRLFFVVVVSGCPWKSTGGVHATQCVCEMTIAERLDVEETRLSWTSNDCVLFFFLSTLSDERCSNLSFESPNQNQKNHTLHSHRDIGGTRRVLWEVTIYWHLPLTKLGFLAVQLRPIFLLKYSMRRAMLQLEFRWSNPMKNTQNSPKRRQEKQRFARRKHWNHVQVTDRPRPDAPSLTQTLIVQMVYCSLANKSWAAYVSGKQANLLARPLRATTWLGRVCQPPGSRFHHQKRIKSGVFLVFFRLSCFKFCRIGKENDSG